MGGLYNQPQSKAEVYKLCHNDTIHYRQTKYNPYLLVKKGWCLIHLVISHKEGHDKKLGRHRLSYETIILPNLVDFT